MAKSNLTAERVQEVIDAIINDSAWVRVPPPRPQESWKDRERNADAAVERPYEIYVVKESDLIERRLKAGFTRHEVQAAIEKLAREGFVVCNELVSVKTDEHGNEVPDPIAAIYTTKALYLEHGALGDGPRPDRSFRFRGEHFKLESRLSRLLTFLWPNKTATYNEVRRLYAKAGKPSLSDVTIRSYASQLNKALSEQTDGRLSVDHERSRLRLKIVD